MDDLVEALQKREHYFLNAVEGEYDANLLRKARYRIEEAARPTADLGGDDGELVERLRRYVSIADGKALASVPPSALRQAADRLILYREALADVRNELYLNDADRAAALIAKIDAVLSRSGG